MNKVAIDLAKYFEGYSCKSYLCPAGKLTGGYGHVFKPGETVRSLFLDEAEVVLAQDLAIAARGAFRLCPGLLKESEGRQGAVIDFVFNLGSGRLKASTLRRRINQKDWGAVIYELKRWVRGGGKILKGLVRRREAEAKFFES